MNKPLGDRALTVYCGLLLALSAFSVDITLPFFDRIRDSMHGDEQSTHAIVTLYIFAIGIGQLFFGPISDRFGRRNAIATGLTVYLVGALVTIMAADITTLLVGRALQGFGGAAAPVTARAIIRDRFSGDNLARNMALASGIFAIGPIVAPLIGAALVAGGGNWRIIFVAMFVLGLLMLAALFWIPETLREKNHSATNPLQIARNTAVLFKHPQSRFFLFLCAWVMVSIMTLLVGLPGVMEKEFAVTGTMFALLFAVHGLGIIAGQIANHWMIGRFGVVRTAVAAAALMTVTFAITLYCVHAGWMDAYGLAAVITFFAVGYLIVFANGASMIMDPHPRIAGFTAAFFGSFTQVVSTTLTMLIMLVVGNSLQRWSLALLVICATTLVALLFWHAKLRGIHASKSTAIRLDR